MNKSNILSCIIALITLISLLYIWPLGLLKVTYENQSKDRFDHISEPLDISTVITGIFIPTYDYLTKMSFKFSNNEGQCNSGNIMLVIQDEHETELYSGTVEIKNLSNQRYFHYPVNITLNSGQRYYYTLSSSDYESAPPCIYLGSTFIGPYEHISFGYNYEYIPNTAPYVKYVYEGKPSLTRSLPYFIVISVISILALIANYYPKKEACEDEDNKGTN